MKRMVCEMCSGNEFLNEFLKENEFFICQNCGTKYSPEDARKIMIEVDTRPDIERGLANGRRALAKQDWGEVEKYYNKVEENDPANIEAVFYSAYGKAMQSLVDPNIFQRQAVFKIFRNSISVIDDNFDMSRELELRPIIWQMCNDIARMYTSDFVYNRKVNEYGREVSSERPQTIQLFNECAVEFVDSVEHIILSLPPELAQNSVWYYQDQTVVLESLIALGSVGNPQMFIDRYMWIHNSWKAVDPSHIVPPPPQPIPTKKGGCYVATCVYGSYDCPEVWTLRRYRDYTLAETWHGRLFIRFYYTVSPTLVKWFGETRWFKKLWKGKLDRMVKRLNSEGFENTPYNDKPW